MVGWIALHGVAWGQVEVLSAKLEDLTAEYADLSTSRGKIRAKVDSKTRYWFRFASVERAQFPMGGTVSVRVRMGTAEGDQLKEIADPATADWLTAIRKLPQPGEIVAVSPKGVTVKLSDQSSFTYRVTEKSKITINGRPTGSSGLVQGQKLYFSGRLLSNYDTWLREASDTPPARTSSSSTSNGRSSTRSVSSKTPPAPLASSGEIEGTIVFFYPNAPIFDLLVDEHRYHITMNTKTAIYVDGKKGDVSYLDLDLNVTVRYRKDRFGRLIASKISTD